MFLFMEMELDSLPALHKMAKKKNAGLEHSESQAKQSWRSHVFYAHLENGQTCWRSKWLHMLKPSHGVR